jgi:PTH1 family peptidyl-tRNA hydrolase
MKIIFGLGNPGQKYKNNRHNIGYMVVDELARSQATTFKRSFKSPADIAKKAKGNDDILIVKPRTFMNNSGSCVKKVLSVYKVDAQDCLIVYDEVDLPLGQVRFRKKGSCAGHRGMSSIISALGSEQINRLRVGIGGERSGELSDYVLSDFSSREKKVLQETINMAALACMDWLSQGADFVMKTYNQRESRLAE